MEPSKFNHRNIKQYIKDNAGLKSFKEMAAETGYNENTITGYGSKMGISLKIIPGKGLEDYVKQWAGIKSAPEIAAEKCCALVSVYEAAQRAGVKLKLRAEVDKNLVKVITERGRELTAREISEITGYTTMTVYYRARVLGVPLKGNHTQARLEMRGDPAVVAKKKSIFNYREYENWLI